MVKPPSAPRIPYVEERHGSRTSDPYHWLRERSDPRVIEYLEQENAYTDAVMKRTAAGQKTLYDEMVGRIQEMDSSVPERIGERYYYTRTETGAEYRFHCRKSGNLGADEELLLDENALAQGEAYFRLGAFEVSPDQRWLAFSVDTNGGETFELRVKDLTTGEMLPDLVPHTYDAVEWAADSRTLFYNMLDETHRPYRLLRHVLGTDPANDKVVFQEGDGAFFLNLYKTRSKRFLILHLESNTTSEAWFLPADDPQGEFRIVCPRKPQVEYSVEHHGDSFHILTNENAVNFRLFEAPLERLEREAWEERIAHRPEVKLEAVEPFAAHLAVVERRDGIQGLRIYDLPGWAEHAVEFPEPVYVAYAGRNPEFETEELRLIYTSLVTPPSVFDYHMRTRRRELKKEQPVLGGFDRSAYRTERVLARAEDGTEVPVSLVYRQGLSPDGSHPLVLAGYGSYGSCTDPAFDANRLSLIDRGFVYALAHVRGGGDLGRPWYEQGKLLNKHNTFTDFIAGAEHLIEAGYTSADRLVIRGGSAGGLLMGAVVNMRPDLFRAVVAKVPFVDVINTMLDPTIPLTVIEWEEWGDPRRREDYDYMLSYSPYDNVAARDYPDMLVTAGLNDPRVAYWEPAKWVAKLRATKTDDNLLLLRTEMGAGHAGRSGRYQHLEELAFEYAFILDRLGVPI